MSKLLRKCGLSQEPTKINGKFSVKFPVSRGFWQRIVRPRLHPPPFIIATDCTTYDQTQTSVYPRCTLFENDKHCLKDLDRSLSDKYKWTAGCQKDEV